MCSLNLNPSSHTPDIASCVVIQTEHTHRHAVVQPAAIHIAAIVVVTNGVTTAATLFAIVAAGKLLNAA